MLPARDWDILRKMRLGFLQAENGLADYWETPAHLGLYDRFFAERIGWKWDAVLSELTQRGFAPTETHLVDWGCGTGIATRRFLEKFPQVESLTLWDRSPLALRFASESIRNHFPNIRLMPWDAVSPPRGIYLLSHVLNELPDAENLLTLLRENATTVLWVEPGTRAVRSQLINLREKLRPHFNLLGPCPHDGPCGLLAPKNAQHWCHHFTKPPSWVHHDPDFSNFARELEIDLSTVPYSYLALGSSTVNRPTEKVIGHPRFFKGHTRLLTCTADGVDEVTLQKRDDPVRFKALQKDR